MSARIIELQTRGLERDDPKPRAKVQDIADCKMKIENRKRYKFRSALLCSLNSVENSGAKSYFYDLIRSVWLTCMVDSGYAMCPFLRRSLYFHLSWSVFGCWLLSAFVGR